MNNSDWGRPDGFHRHSNPPGDGSQTNATGLLVFPSCPIPYVCPSPEAHCCYNKHRQGTINLQRFVITAALQLIVKSRISADPGANGSAVSPQQDTDSQASTGWSSALMRKERQCAELARPAMQKLNRVAPALRNWKISEKPQCTAVKRASPSLCGAMHGHLSYSPGLWTKLSFCHSWLVFNCFNACSLFL